VDKDKKLQEILDNDPLGLLNIKPAASPARNEDERLVASFQEIIDFYEKNNRAPEAGGGVQEYQLNSRLKSIKENPLKSAKLKGYDTFGLLKAEHKEIKTIEEILDNDPLGLLNDDDSEGLFEFKHIKRVEERASAEFVARRKPCKDFANYEQRFKEVQKDLKNNKRKLIEFKQGNLREGEYYVHNGILFFVEKINITTKEHYKEDGTRVREDGRTRCIFENGTESNMLKRSVEKILYANGKVVSENTDKVNEKFVEKFSNITEQDEESGFIYILKSKSNKKEITEIDHLYKIGYSSTSVEERVKNAQQDPTYLMADADVRIVITYKCFNMNPQKLEQLLHNFFGKSCLNIDVFDKDGLRHTPREWFIAPLAIIEEAVHYIISGDIVQYKYDAATESIVLR